MEPAEIIVTGEAHQFADILEAVDRTNDDAAFVEERFNADQDAHSAAIGALDNHPL